MEEIKIGWVKTNYSEVGDYYDTYYYAFSRGSNLLYIGISYRQNVKTEIAQTLRRLGINVNGLSIWLGYVNSEQTTYGRITEQIVLDAECLMIFTNQPTYNTQCKENYTGRCNFKVKTIGCPLIRRCVKCENYEISFEDKWPESGDIINTQFDELGLNEGDVVQLPSNTKFYSYNDFSVSCNGFELGEDFDAEFLGHFEAKCIGSPYGPDTYSKFRLL